MRLPHVLQPDRKILRKFEPITTLTNCGFVLLSSTVINAIYWRFWRPPPTVDPNDLLNACEAERNFYMFAANLHRRNVLAALTGGMLPATARAAAPFRIEERSGDEQIKTFVKVVADAAGGSPITWSSGSLFAWMPGLGGHHVCDIHGISTHRFVKTENEWTHHAREGLMCSNINSTEPLTAWHNPFTQQDVSVEPAITDQSRQFFAHALESWTIGDHIGFADNRSSLSKAPMTVETYPLFAQSNLFKFVNLNTYYAPVADIAASESSSAAMTGVNTSVSPWLPWMRMGQRRGWLVWQQRLKKVSSVENLPAHLTSYWQRKAPKLFDPPDVTDGKWETPWTSFKTAVDAARTAVP